MDSEKIKEYAQTKTIEESIQTPQIVSEIHKGRLKDNRIDTDVDIESNVFESDDKYRVKCINPKPETEKTKNSFKKNKQMFINQAENTAKINPEQVKITIPDGQTFKSKFNSELTPDQKLSTENHSKSAFNTQKLSEADHPQNPGFEEIVEFASYHLPKIPKPNPLHKPTRAMKKDPPKQGQPPPTFLAKIKGVFSKSNPEDKPPEIKLGNTGGFHYDKVKKK